MKFDGYRADNQSPSNQGKQVYFQGSKQIDNFSRRYYERELGPVTSPSIKEHFGYTEPFRRFYNERASHPRPTPSRMKCHPGCRVMTA